MAYSLFRDKAFGVKLEATPGTRETLAASDYGLELTEMGTTTGVEVIENQTFRGSISATPSRIGKITGSVTLAGELKNSGVANTEPKISTILQMARMAKNTVKTAVIGGAANASTLLRGVSVITGAVSGATGLVIKFVDSTTDTLYYVQLTGTAFQSGEAISSGTFSGTITSFGTNAGFAYIPASSNASQLSATIDMGDGGIAKSIYGAVANFKLDLTTESYPSWSAEVTGVLDDSVWGTAYVDVPGITYESHAPAVVNNALMRIDGTVAPVASTVSFDLGNTINIIKDLNSDNWLRHGVVTSRTATGSMQVLALDPAVYSAYTQLFAGSTATLDFTIGGTTAGTGINVFAPACQYTGVSESDDNGFVSQSIDLKLTGIDNEVIIWFL